MRLSGPDDFSTFDSRRDGRAVKDRERFLLHAERGPWRRDDGSYRRLHREVLRLLWTLVRGHAMKVQVAEIALGTFAALSILGNRIRGIPNIATRRGIKLHQAFYHSSGPRCSLFFECECIQMCPVLPVVVKAKGYIGRV
jgi:hypothetical protein